MVSSSRSTRANRVFASGKSPHLPLLSPRSRPPSFSAGLRLTRLDRRYHDDGTEGDEFIADETLELIKPKRRPRQPEPTGAAKQLEEEEQKEESPAASPAASPVREPRDDPMAVLAEASTAVETDDVVRMVRANTRLAMSAVQLAVETNAALVEQKEEVFSAVEWLVDTFKRSNLGVLARLLERCCLQRRAEEEEDPELAALLEL